MSGSKEKSVNFVLILGSSLGLYRKVNLPDTRYQPDSAQPDIVGSACQNLFFHDHQKTINENSHKFNLIIRTHSH